MFPTRRLSAFPAAVVKANSVNVDAVSGATMTRKGILEGVAAAIVAAGGKVADFNKRAPKAAAPKGVEKVTTDVLVVGGGAGGLAAAVRAANARARMSSLLKSVPTLAALHSLTPVRWLPRAHVISVKS